MEWIQLSTSNYKMAGELHEEFRTKDPKRIANCEPRFLLRARTLYTFLD
jgi:hypothetical protein